MRSISLFASAQILAQQPDFPPRARATDKQKAAACFARRVKFVAQKYSSFRNSEVMI
jgi:hypothetical protein